MSVALVASIGEPKDWTPAGLAWKGVQEVASSIGATPSLLEPVSDAELKTDLEQAAGADGAVVVTVGAAANRAVQAAAATHPGTHFFELDVAVPDGSQANVHGLVFDEAEAGYLGGYIAAAFTTSGKAGMVGDSKTDTRSGNYAAGFKNGAAQASSSVAVTIAYAGSANQPDLGRTAAAGLIKAGNGAILAMPSLAGVGALRQACAGLVPVVAVDTDAWQTLPDIHPCLIVSVMKRYDVAVSTAILTIAGGGTAERLTVYDVANGGIALSDFHAAQPAGFQGGLDAVMATLRSGPPRPTPVPSASPSSAAKSPSPKP
jgi:basic membrane protein A